MFFLTGYGIHALYRRNIDRGRHVVYNCVKQLLYALVTVRSAASHGNELVCQGGFTDGLLYLCFGNFFTFKVFFKK